MKERGNRGEVMEEEEERRGGESQFIKGPIKLPCSGLEINQCVGGGQEMARSYLGEAVSTTKRNCACQIYVPPQNTSGRYLCADNGR